MEEEKKSDPVVKPTEKGTEKGADGKKDKKDKKDKNVKELSAEDQALLDGLELAVERTRDADKEVAANAVKHLISEVRRFWGPFSTLGHNLTTCL